MSDSLWLDKYPMFCDYADLGDIQTRRHSKWIKWLGIIAGSLGRLLARNLPLKHVVMDLSGQVFWGIVVSITWFQIPSYFLKSIDRAAHMLCILSFAPQTPQHCSLAASNVGTFIGKKTMKCNQI